MKIALAQINTTVGDFEGNLQKIRQGMETARDLNADLVVFPEQAIPGYPAEDLLERPDFVRQGQETLAAVVEASREIEVGVILGTLTPTAQNIGKPVFNSATLIESGKVIGQQHKTLLPTYDVFDEGRYFESASEHEVFDFHGMRLGMLVCEDVWNDPSFWSHRLYKVDPVKRLVEKGAEILIVISASPFSVGRRGFRIRMFQNLVKRWDLPMLFVNLVGGNTTLIFDGNSLAMDKQGQLLAKLKGFEEDFVVVDTGGVDSQRDESGSSQLLVAESKDEVAEAYKALVLGTRDYLHKTGFSKSAVIGLSGGIDSSLTAVIAVDALGSENVIGVSMPSRYSSEGSKTDARLLADRLKIVYHEIPIEDIFVSMLKALDPVFKGLPEDVTEENLQARARGQILMALSNKLNALLLTTGNKSELAVGYCTLYGDMCGGLAVISDVPKTLAYRLARYINRGGEIIPQNVIDKPPSAELRPDQKDQDSLPPYEVLDRVLEAYIEEGASPGKIATMGISRKLVDEIIGMVNRNEYKRKQAAPGLRITSKAFGPGRRFPIVQKF